MIQNSLDDDLFRPGCVPHRFFPDDGSVELVSLERADFHRLAFLDDRGITAEQSMGRHSLADLGSARTAGENQEFPNIDYIFHSAFCCSTLLARCFDIEGKVLVLREPSVLTDLANAKRVNHPFVRDPDRWHGTLGLTLSLLAKPFVEGERVLIKPTNIANNLISDALSFREDSRALLLYSDLRSFLISVLKKGEPGRAFARKWFYILNMDSPIARDWPKETVIKLTDLQIATVVWRMQLAGFIDLLGSTPRHRVRTLDCRQLLAAPEAVLCRVADFFVFEMTQTEIEAVARGPLFNRHSKDMNQEYNAELRAEENLRIEKTHGEVLDQLITWERNLDPGRVITLPLANAL